MAPQPDRAQASRTEDIVTMVEPAGHVSLRHATVPARIGIRQGQAKTGRSSMKSLRFRRVATCMAVSGFAWCIPDAEAQSVAEFYKGKTIRMVVASDPGGGYDVYARTFAPHYARNIPGQPHIIVQNMQGAGGVLATNW